MNPLGERLHLGIGLVKLRLDTGQRGGVLAKLPGKVGGQAGHFGAVLVAGGLGLGMNARKLGLLRLDLLPHLFGGGRQSRFTGGGLGRGLVRSGALGGKRPLGSLEPGRVGIGFFLQPFDFGQGFTQAALGGLDFGVGLLADGGNLLARLTGGGLPALREGGLDALGHVDDHGRGRGLACLLPSVDVLAKGGKAAPA